MINTCQM